MENNIQVYKYDSEGFFIKPIIIGKSDNAEFKYTTEIRPVGLYKPKWDGTKWIEGMTQEEIDELNNYFKLPTESERIDMLENMILMMMEG